MGGLRKRLQPLARAVNQQTPPVTAALKDPDAAVRRSVALSLGEMGSDAKADVHDKAKYMSDDDVRAMATYLKTIPQKKEAPETMQYETSEKFGDELLQTGKKVYTDNCAKCHADNGLGKPPAYPPLATNQSIQMPSAVNPTPSCVARTEAAAWKLADNPLNGLAPPRSTRSRSRFSRFLRRNAGT